MSAGSSNSSLKDAILQRVPFPSIQTEVYLTLVRTSDVVLHTASRPLRRTGLTLQQYNVLRILRGAGSRGLLVHEVTERMVTRAPNITRLVDKLEGKGLVTRARSEGDRRTVRLHLTEAGGELLGRLEEPIDSEVRETMSGLGEGDLESLRELLDRLRNHLEEK